MLKTNRFISIVLAIVMVLSMVLVGVVSASAALNDYCLFGYINGADYGMNDDWQNVGSYVFDASGKLTTTFTQDSYVAVKNVNCSDWYMFQAYEQGTSGTLYNTNTGTAEKMFIPGNVELTFTLVDNGDGSLSLSYSTGGNGGGGDVTPTTEPVPTPELSGETMTIYFQNNWMWPTPQAHFWAGTVLCNEWPGEVLTNKVETTAEGYDIYALEIPVETTGIVFNGMGEYGEDKSEDVTDIQAGYCYYMTYDEPTATKPCGSYLYAEPTTDAPTQATDDPNPAPVSYVKVDGVDKIVALGDVITYTYKMNVSDITANGKIVNIEGSTYYDSSKLKVLNYNTEDHTDMFPIIWSAGLIANSIEDEITFNASVLSGMLFNTDDSVVIKAQFEVIAEGNSEITTNIKNMKDTDQNILCEDYVVTEGKQWNKVEALDAPERPSETEPQPTQTEPQPTQTEPQPTQTEPQPTTEPTEPTTPGREGNFITVDGVEYPVSVGDELTYYAYLNVSECTTNAKIASIDCKVTYPSNVVAFVETVDEYGDSAKKVMFPILETPITNFAPEGEDGVLYFNYSSTDGVRFNTNESVLAKLTFKVVAEGNGVIDTDIRTMAKTDDDLTKIVYNSQRLEQFYYAQKLEGNTGEQPTETEPPEIPTTPDVEGLFIKADGTLYRVTQGKTYTYYAYLTLPTKLQAIDATTWYDATGLTFVPTVDSYGDQDKMAMWPIIGSAAVVNTGIEGEILYNYSNTDGVRFPEEDSILAKFDFKVDAESGVYEINTVIDRLADVDMVDYVVNGETIKDFGFVQEIEGEFAPEPSTTPSETEPSTTPSETEPSTTPSETEQTEPSTEPTTPGVDPEKIYVKLDGVLYEVEYGQKFNYTYYLNSDKKISSLDATTFYDAAGLKFNPAVDEYGDPVLVDMFPVLQTPIFNNRVEGQIIYNYSNVSGVRLPVAEEMNEKNIVFTGEFEVIGEPGIYEINTTLRTLGDSDNVKLVYNGEVVDGAVVNQLEKVDLEPSPIIPPSTQPSETEPSTTPSETEPSTQPSETVPTPSVKPSEDETDKPSEGETVPDAQKPSAPATSDQKAPTNGNAVQTGSTQAAIAFLTILVMAAGIVLYAKRRKFD